MITINPELQSLIPPLTPEEYTQLEQNILQDGCHDPLVVWQETQTLLDGHHRYAICERHGLPYHLTELSLPDLDAAKQWMIANQLGRRNLTPEQMSYFRGEQYNLMKRQGKRTDLTSPQSEEKLQSPAHRLAEHHQVSRATIERDGAFARAVDTLAAVAGPEARQVLLARVERLPRQVVQQLATLAETDPTTAKDLLVAAFAAPTPQAAAACIRQATTCGVCHRPLTNPTSMQRGIGPICACARGHSGPAPAHHGESSGRFSSEMRVSTDEVEQPDTPPPMPETVVPLPAPTSTLDVPTLLRATAVYLEAIQKGLADGAFAETFDQYGSLWDAVHDGCVHLLDMLDGDADEGVAAPVPVEASAVATPDRTAGSGMLPAKVWAALQTRECGAPAAELATAIDAPRKQVWQALERMVKQGKAVKKGTTYAIRKEKR